MQLALASAMVCWPTILSDCDDAAEDPFSTDSLRRVWGHLPEVFQQELQSPLREDFLPSYRRVIEDYFRSLSSESPQ
jgi:hypothetical protein